MRLYKLKIEGFRKIKKAEVVFGDATFLIGENNVGKSTILSAIEFLLSSSPILDDHQYSRKIDTETGEEICESDTVILTAEFRNVPEIIINHRGFNKQRLISYEPIDGTDSGLAVVYRKTYKRGSKVLIEMQLSSQNKKAEFDHCKKPIDYKDAGIDENLLREIFNDDSFEKNITKKDEGKLEDISAIWNINPDDKTWIPNPGGIAGNVLSKLPSYLLISADNKSNEIDKDKGSMYTIMHDLFKEVRDSSVNYQRAQEYLNLLAKELDSQDEDKEFGKMMKELNHIIDGVFPCAKINATAILNDPNSALKPDFSILMSSNVSTPIQYQGTGMIRAAVFSLLRYRKQWEERKNQEFNRGLIIGFEEPEIYLHPNAANKMRDTIYELACDNSQIICTTHSPYMIDLSRKPKLVLNICNLNQDEFVNINPFNISDEFVKLQEDDKVCIKMLQKMDDHIARVFFAKRVIIVEGDTDALVLNKTIELMYHETKKKVLSDFQIIKARGKAAIIPLIKYLRAMNIDVFVIHDRDNETEGARIFNNPILNEIGDENKRLMMCECIEEELGYAPPSYEKPYKAYLFTNDWNNWDDIPERWRDHMKKVFVGYLD